MEQCLGRKLLHEHSNCCADNAILALHWQAPSGLGHTFHLWWQHLRSDVWTHSTHSPHTAGRSEHSIHCHWQGESAISCKYLSVTHECASKAVVVCFLCRKNLDSLDCVRMHLTTMPHVSHTKKPIIHSFIVSGNGVLGLPTILGAKVHQSLSVDILVSMAHSMVRIKWKEHHCYPGK